MSGPKRILLVEPEEVLAEVTAFRLELLGYFVDRVTTPDEAFRHLAESRPDLIITDLQLPGSDAIGFVERLSSDQETSELPIMVLSFDADLDKVQAAHNAGAREFLVVPFQPEHLEEKAARILTVKTKTKKKATV